jgi:phosphoribosylanthranilate isomerase
MPKLTFPARGLVQIAGIRDPREALMLAGAGTDWIGLPLRPGWHKPEISDSRAAIAVRALPSRCAAVLITYQERASDILELCSSVGCRAAQLHGTIGIAEVDRLRRIAPALFIIRSLVVRPDNAAALEAEVAEMAPLVDAFLTDTFDPGSGACGATGRTHDWSVSLRLRKISPLPLILAGGLTPENVAAAIAEVAPAGVDAHTGLEDPEGRKDRDKVRRFVAGARIAWRGPAGPSSGNTRPGA